MKKCYCVYKKGKQIGLCLRCAKMEIIAFERGRKRVIKLMLAAYRKRGKPYWFINITDIKYLKNNEEIPL